MILSVLLMVHSTSGMLVANLDDQNWYRQDKLLMSALISTLFDRLLPHVVGISTSHSLEVILFSFSSSIGSCKSDTNSPLRRKALSQLLIIFKRQGFAHMLAAIGHPFQESDVVHWYRQAAQLTSNCNYVRIWICIPLGNRFIICSIKLLLNTLHIVFPILC